MKKKIRREFILVALFTITLTTLLVTAVFYEFFKKEVMDELDIDIQVLQETGVFETADIENGLREMPLDDLRISLIAQDGSVLYDNDANVGNLGNHGDMERKFDKLLRFYRSGLMNIGWGEYRTIDIRYNDQVVCKK